MVETKNIIIKDNTELKTQIISIKEKYEKDNNELKTQEKSLLEIIKEQKSQLLDLKDTIVSSIFNFYYFIFKYHFLYLYLFKKNEISDKHKVEQTLVEIKTNYELKLEEKNSEILTLKSSLDEITGNKLGEKEFLYLFLA